MSDIVITQTNGVAFVDFAQPEILSLMQATSIGAQLGRVVDEKEAFDMLIDFKRVRLITSSMIGELIKLKKKCDDGNVELKFCNLSSDLLSILKKLKLDRSFAIYASRDDAVKAVARGRK